jgi:energy-coupling factor transporter transmembrane protein EcfT
MTDIIQYQLFVFLGCLIVALMILKGLKAASKWYRRVFWSITGSFIALLFAETMYFLYTV